MSSTVPLAGMDGGNPLGFLAALGTLRTLTMEKPEWSPRLAWRLHAHWLPVLHLDSAVDDDCLLDALDAALCGRRGHEALTWGDDTKLSTGEFAELLRRARGSASASSRAEADLLSGLASDAIEDPDAPGQVADTALRTMRGSGHQHFLLFMRNLASDCTREHLRRTLFQPWDYADPMKNHSLRLDPVEFRQHAYQWRDPGKETARRSKAGAMWGANRLAVEAVALLQCVPRSGVLETVAFRGHKASDTELVWPLWSPPATVDVAASLLSHPCLADVAGKRSELKALGIPRVFSARRFTAGKFRSFSPAVPE